MQHNLNVQHLRGFDRAATAFTDSLQQLVATQNLAHGFVAGIRQIQFDGGSRRVGLTGQQRFRFVVDRNFLQ